MSSPTPPLLEDATEELAALIATLHATGRRLEQLTSGEVDTVADHDGRTFVLGRAQEQLRQLEAAKQAAILNALPAHIALLDAQGVIVSVNDAWREFGAAGAVQCPGHQIGVDYLGICDSADAEDSALAHDVAEGIRSVLAGRAKSFSIEYSCQSATDLRWFLMTANPLAPEQPNGAVVMQLDITRRRLTQAALARSEDGLHRAEVIAKLAHVITGPDGAFERWSETLPRLVGVEPEAMPRNTRDWIRVLHPEDQERFRQATSDAATHKLRVDIEYRLQRADGEWLDIRHTMEPVRTVSEAADGPRRFNTLQDITAERQAEKGLRASELRFRQMADNIKDVFFLRDADRGRMLYVSPAYEEIWGRSCESLYADPASWAAAIHPEDRAATAARSVPGTVSGTYEVEFRIVRPDGSIRWIETKGFPVRGTDGSIARVAGVAEDITQRKLADHALRESERRFSDVLANVEMVSMMLDRSARITYCNDYLLRLTGWQREEVIGRDWFEAFIPPELADLPATFARLIADDPALRHHENEILTRSGERRLIRWNNSLLRSAAGEVIGTASIGEDITEQKRAELRIRRLNRVYAVLSTINTLIVHVRSREELFREACRIAVAEGGFRMAWIGMVDAEAGGVKPLASAGEVGDFFESAPLGVTETKAGSHGLAGRAVRTLGAIVSNDVHSDPQRLMKPELAARGINSVAVIPLLVEGVALGLLSLYSSEVGFFDDEEMRLLNELARDISFAIQHIAMEKERTQAEARVQRLNRVYAVLSGINTLIVRVHDRDELFRGACRIAVEQGRFKMAWIGVVDRSAMQVKPIAWDGNVQDYIERMPLGLNEAEPATFGLAGRAVCGKQAIVVQDMETDPRVLLHREAAALGFHSLVMLPLVVADSVVGVLALYASEIAFFDEGEMKLILELAGDIAFAIDHIDKLERLDYLAYYDSLTGLANRTLFLERVAQYMRSAAREGHQLALFVVDLERFKSINDSLGRPAGDALLQQVAEWLTRNLGDANLLARVGPDHFAVVLPRVDPKRNVVGLVEKTAAAFMAHPFRLNDAVFRVAFKIGAALYPEDAGDADTLFKNAEAALKKAKARGERYLFYKEKMNEAVAGKLTLENQLRQALDKGEFVLHYQPKVSLVSRKLTGAEALIRWNDPRTGLVPPGRFIPVLEETGLIRDVGRWALKQAMQDHLRWRAAGLGALRIAVNVSPLQLRHRDFIAEIRQVVELAPQAAAGVELEITEGVIMEDIKHNIAILNAIRALGVTVAIDDFGTGFSSLAYLSKLPIDTLKIDRSFVIDMTVDAQGLALVSTIITLAHSLKLKVVAEGVETEEQSRLLRLIGCDEMQGYLFSKPVPADIFETKFLVPQVASQPA